MVTRAVLERVKRATVGIALVPDRPPTDPGETPFTILGSGFCVHPRGVIVTCEHVISAFVHGDIRQMIAKLPAGASPDQVRPIPDMRLMRPHALFYLTDVDGENLHILTVPMEAGVAKLEYDLGAMRVASHGAYPEGYPYLEVEPFEELYEGMEVATCGFPLGNDLQTQLGTFTSSFTRGIVSSIIPAPGAAEQYVTGFQLDLTATFGNSGGPVFSWASGRVFGVLQGGPQQQSGEPLHGIARAESIYKFIRENGVQRLLDAKLPSQK